MKTTKNLKAKRKPLVACISEERILQLSNDMSEDIRSGTVEEWRAVAKHFRTNHDRLWNELGVLRCEIVSAIHGDEIYQLGIKGLKTWLGRQTPDSTA